MFSKELIQTLFGYHCWANARVLECAQKVSESDYFAATGYSHGSLHALLFHLLRVDHLWRIVCQEGKRPAAPLRPEDFPDLETIRARWPQEEQAMRQFIAGLSGDQIEGVVQITDWRGNPFSTPLWRILLHVILHGMQHRSEAAELVTRYGQSPGNLDFIFYPQSTSSA